MNIRRLWLLFAQVVTGGAALLLVFALFGPRFNDGAQVVTVKEADERAATAAPAGLSFRDAAHKAMPSVVNIYTAKIVRQPRAPLYDNPLLRRFFGEMEEAPPERAVSLGSGVIVSPQGHVLTNNHVIEAADEIAVVLPGGRAVPAKIIGADPETDLAVLQLKIEKPSAITFADSDKIQVGDAVLAIGNPFGVGQTVTFGIVSATGRADLGINTFENFIQTDAAINPGNSGGALVDLNGRLVGINTAIFSETGGSLGIGFAIPANLARQVMEQILAGGTVVRGWIGVDVRPLSPEIAAAVKAPDLSGVFIAGVLRGGPADRAGIRPGDVLLALNDKPLAGPSDLLNGVAAVKPGQVATFAVRRGTDKADVRVTVGRRPRPGRTS